MELTLILATGTLCIVCFFIGAKVGQQASKGETIVTPEINPIKAIQEHRERKAQEEAQNRVNVIMRNIERYDGTDYGQEDVPG